MTTAIQPYQIDMYRAAAAPIQYSTFGRAVAPSEYARCELCDVHVVYSLRSLIRFQTPDRHTHFNAFACSACVDAARADQVNRSEVTREPTAHAPDCVIDHESLIQLPDGWVECAGCFNRVNDASGQLDNTGHLVCPTCISSGTYITVCDGNTLVAASDVFTCGDCGNRFMNQSGNSVHRASDVCDDCLESGYLFSDRMNEYIRAESSVEVDGNDHCTLRYARNNLYQYGDGTWHSEPEDAEDDEGSDDEEESNERLRAHSTNVLQVLSVAPVGSALVYGVELEVEFPRSSVRNEFVESLGAVGNDYVLKEDGSLDHGAEIVTRPGTLEQHRNEFCWQEWLSAAVEHDGFSGKSGSHCGLHVHVNRAAMTSLQIGKFLVFMNSPNTQDLVRLVAQRDANQYCVAYKKKVTDGKRARNEGGDRYQAVNVNEKYNTLEVRIFKGNLRYSRVMKAIEFCDALVQFTAQCSVREAEAPDAFLDWLHKNRHAYKHLCAFLAEKGPREHQYIELVKPRSKKDPRPVADTADA